MQAESTGAPDRPLRLLVAAPFAPRVEASHGGGRAIGSLLARLAERHRVALVCLRGDDEPAVADALRARCELVEEVQRPPASRQVAWRTRLARPAKLAGAPPDLVAQARVEPYGKRLSAIASAFRPDLVQFEMAEMAQYASTLAGSRARRLLVDHDPGAAAARDRSHAAGGLKRLSRRLDEIAWRRYSRRSLAAMDAVVVFTERDAESMRALAPGVPVHRIPIAVELPEHALGARGIDPPTLLFAGGYVHPPNADAAIRLIRAIVPTVRARHPDLVLELVGADPTPEMVAAAGDGVVVTGEVPSLTPHLERAAVVVAPVRLGGGMRVKVLEALAAGKAVVASSRAAEGLEVESWRQMVIADGDSEFAAAVSELVEDEQRRIALGRSARAWAEANLDWDRVAAAYEGLYRTLLAADD